MYEKNFITQAVNRSATTQVDRRRLFTMLGVAGAGAAVATATTGGAANAAVTLGPATDGAVLNFALNLEYLEAEFYLRAVTGRGLDDKDVTGTGTPGKVAGGKEVPWKSKRLMMHAREIARDEREHVRFLRGALGTAAVSRPAIDFTAAFTAAAKAAGVITKGTFNPFASETNFLLGAFLFEDVGVTAYKGAAGLISNKGYLEAAAGILAVEAYHAGAIRAILSDKGSDSLNRTVKKLSDARDSLDGTSDDDQGISESSYGDKKPANQSNLVPTDRNGIVYSRTPAQVLNIVYLNPAKDVTKGGFFPAGVNGAVNSTSFDSSVA